MISPSGNAMILCSYKNKKIHKQDSFIDPKMNVVIFILILK